MERGLWNVGKICTLIGGIVALFTGGVVGAAEDEINPLCFQELQDRVTSKMPPFAVDQSACVLSAGTDDVYEIRRIGVLSSGAEVFLSTESSGGSGQFTTLFSVFLRAGQIIHDHRFVTGDRCMGGIVDAKVQDGVLFYTVYATPQDYLALSRAQGVLSVAAFDKIKKEGAGGFPGCATCCRGKITYREAEADQLDFRPISDYFDPSAPRTCFERQVVRFEKAGQGIISKNQIRPFLRGLVDECIP